MAIQNRYLNKAIISDLSNGMVYLAGPRQIGKTSFAREILSKKFKSQYFDWDKFSERVPALNGEWSQNAPLVVLDEFYKHKKWEHWIHGEYDTLKNNFHFLLIGSANFEDKKQDVKKSQKQRSRFYTLHPFSIAELNGTAHNNTPGEELVFPDKLLADIFPSLFKFGGFPEPFLKQEDEFSQTWNSRKIDQLFKEDIRDLTLINDFGALSLMVDYLPSTISLPFSINALAKHLGKNFRTMVRWLDVFEEFYFCFRLSPFQSKMVESVKKEKKLYFFDWSQIEDHNARMENFVATHLLKFCDYLNQHEGHTISLSYLRDVRGTEVDFLVCSNNKPWFAVQIYGPSSKLSTDLLFFKEKLKLQFCYQLVSSKGADFLKKGVRVISVEKFLAGLV